MEDHLDVHLDDLDDLDDPLDYPLEDHLYVHLDDLDDMDDHSDYPSDEMDGLDDPLEDHLDVHLYDLDDMDDHSDYPLEDHLDDRPAYATGASVQLCCIAASDIRWEIKESKSSLLWKSAFNIAFPSLKKSKYFHHH